jgi:hypothetical protein
MRIRTALTGLALGAASLFLITPAAFASGAASAAPQPPTTSTTASPTVQPPPSPTSTRLPAPPAPVLTTTANQRPRPAVVKPKGAAETGGGFEAESTQGSGVFLVGGAALLAVGGVGAVGYRRFRRQS